MTKPARNICREFSPVDTMSPKQLAARVLALESNLAAHLSYLQDLIERNKRLREKLWQYLSVQATSRVEKGTNKPCPNP